MKIIPHANGAGEIDGLICSVPDCYRDAQMFKIIFGWPELWCCQCNAEVRDGYDFDFKMTKDGWACKHHPTNKTLK